MLWNVQESPVKGSESPKTTPQKNIYSCLTLLGYFGEVWETYLRHVWEAVRGIGEVIWKALGRCVEENNENQHEVVSKNLINFFKQQVLWGGL